MIAIFGKSATMQMSKDDKQEGGSSFQDKELQDFVNKLRDNQKDMPPEFAKIVDEHFWELFDE